ncbi:MAG: arginine deiminase [Spirochaetota bacterium]
MGSGQIHNEITFQVFSEIEPLQTVLLHRPGRELESLTPQYLDTMLFEDIPYLEKMVEEHDLFAQTLRSAGCRVLYMTELLEEILARKAVKEYLIQETVNQSQVRHSRIREDIAALLHDLPPADLARQLIGGVLKSEVPFRKTAPDLSYFIRDEYPYYISPLPNLYFTRDPGTVIGNGFSVNRMRTEARRRETLILSSLVHHLSSNLNSQDNAVGLLEDYTDESPIEGGDILVLSKTVLAVGCSARTEAWAIEKLAQHVLTADGFQTMLVVQIPFIRAYMHLDTVLTMVDYDKFTIYPGVEKRLKVFHITKKSSGQLRVVPEDDFRGTLMKVLGLPAVDLIQTGGGDAITAAREQWNDSTNTLALSPGRVVTYRRNVVSNETLTQHGIEVLTVAGSELVRGRGGPRCMSMPLTRSETIDR